VIIRLSHTDLGVDDLDAAERFYVATLGFLVAHRNPDALHLRAAEEFDTWSLKLSLGSPALRSFTFRVESEGDLDELTQLHEKLGAEVEQLPVGHEPGLGRAVRVRTPDGHNVRFVHEVEEVSLVDPDGVPRLPMRRTDREVGVPPARIHHVNLRVADVDDSLAYWRDRLQFSISERVVDTDESTRIAWVRRSHASHDVGLGRAGEPGMHHLAYALPDPASVIRTCDVLADAGYRDQIEFGPGRHGVSNAMTVYAFDPSGHRLEFFTSDYVRDHDRPPVTWGLDAYTEAGRLWWGPAAPASFLEQASPIAEPA
jgi:catechol 2,3-dioxygenase